LREKFSTPFQIKKEKFGWKFLELLKAYNGLEIGFLIEVEWGGG
jgi:hypothetical protein